MIPFGTSRPLQSIWKRLPFFVASVVCVAAAVALVSWRLHFLAVFFSLRGSPPVAPDAALAFLLAGINIFLLFRRRTHWMQWASGLLFLMGGFSLPVFNLSPLPSQVGRFFFGLAGMQFDGSFPTMSLTAGIGFGFWGLGLLAFRTRKFKISGNYIAAACGTLVVSLGCICLLNLWFGFPIARDDAPGRKIFHMSAGTSLLFCLVGSALCGAVAKRVRFRSEQQASNIETTTRFLVALALLLLFVGVNVTLSLGLDESAKTKAEVARTYQSAEAVQEVVAALREAESGQRTYLLTGDESYLRAYRKGLQRVQSAQEDHLPRAQDWADYVILSRLTARKIFELNETIRLRQTGQDEALNAFVLTGRGLATMERLEDHARHIGFVFSSFISEQNGLYKREVQMVKRTILASYALAVCLLACAAFFFDREIRRRTRVEGKLRAQELELANRIEERTAELKASEARYRAMLDQSPVAVHVLDRYGNSLGINSAFERLSGVSEGQMQGYNIWKDPQPAAQGTLGLLQRAFAGETTATGAIPHVPSLSAGTPLASGTARTSWAEVVAYPVKNSIGEVQEVVLLCQDVTERELALISVRESELKFRQLADVLPQIVWTAKPDGTLDYYNERWYTFTGYSPDAGQSWEPILHPEDLPVSLETWERSIQTKTPFEVEQRLWDRARGDYRWHLARAVPIFDDKGGVKRWFGSTTEIHEQKAAEEILEQKVCLRTAELQHSYQLLQSREDELRRSLGERDILFREVHHRVKNNLQVISSLLRMQGDLLKNEPAAAVALEESRRRVLSMSMIHERLYGDRSIDSIDFADYTQTLVKELTYSYSLPGRKVKTSIQVDQVHLKVDQAIPCGLILNELMTNALKYAFVGKQSGELSVSLRRTPAGEVSLSVSDNGVGLPDQFNWKTSSSLGLPIVDILARQLDGSVEYESRNGARFTVRFPTRDTAEKAA